MSSEDVRRHNVSLVLDQLADGPRSRTELAHATGLVRGSITSYTAELISAGLIRQADVVPGAGRGRPQTRLEIAADDFAVVTALLDSDHATAVVSTLGGVDLLRVSRRHGRPLGDPEAVLDVLAAVLDEALTLTADLGRKRFDLSVVFWGPVTGNPPVVLASTDLGWRVTDVCALLTDRLPRLATHQIHLVTDSTVAALEEHASVGSPSEFIYLKADAGIGGAVFVGGRSLASPLRPAGMLGHLPVIDDGLPCRCGQRGCLNTVAGPEALLAASGLKSLADAEGQKAAMATFVAAALAGEPVATAVWVAARRQIARTLQVLNYTLAPYDIMLGGYLAPFATDIAAELSSLQATLGTIAAPRVHGSTLGPDAALRGAKRVARRRAFDTFLS